MSDYKSGRVLSNESMRSKRTDSVHQTEIALGN
jgi:hypothetical protein